MARLDEIEMFIAIGRKEDKFMPRNEYYKLLKAAYERTDWNDLNSVKAYNEYARKLRKQLRED